MVCTDKTGTLTAGEMKVEAIHVDGRTLEVTGIGYEPEGEFRLDGEVITTARLRPPRPGEHSSEVRTDVDR